jgi:hypothetical protein
MSQEQPDRAEVFVHNMISEFEAVFEKFLLSNNTELNIADGIDGQKNKFVHIIYHQFKKAYKLQDNVDNHEFIIDPGSIPDMDKLLMLMLQNAVELRCKIKYIKPLYVNFLQDSIKPPPNAQIKLTLIKTN